MNFITTGRLEDLLNDLAAKSQLIAPVREGDRCFYRPVASAGQIEWEFGKPTLPIKEYFFPATERLLEIHPVERKNGGGGVRDYQVFETLPAAEQVIFGVRPCDARGLRALDALFLNKEPADPYYARRRERTTLIGVACETLMDSCFCTTMGGAPDERRDLDILLHRSEDGFIADPVTDQGARLLTDLALEPWEGDLPDYDRPVGWVLPEKKVMLDYFDDRYWRSMAERCMSCRLCAYACPTCRCFDVRDVRLPSVTGEIAFERIRFWDSCARPGYRMIAGGHNPRAEKGERLRNRLMCKIFYYEDQCGEVGCTGCGRCVDVCPVNIDIMEVMRFFAEKQGAAT